MHERTISYIESDIKDMISNLEYREGVLSKMVNDLTEYQNKINDIRKKIIEQTKTLKVLKGD